MIYFLLLLILAPIVYLALRQKKWYLYLLMAFVGILPEQFSVSVHSALPLITGSRVLIVIAFGFWAWNRIKTRNFKLPIPLMIFLAVQVLVSLVNLRWGADEIKRIFLFVFERVFLVVMLMDLIETREEFERSVDFLILGGVAVTVIAIVQTVWKLDIAAALHITETITSVTLPSRMGLIRAYGTFNAISYGCYCAFLLPVIYYRLEQTKKHLYSLAFALVFVALICTFTRSAWLCAVGILGLIVLLNRFKPVVRLLPSAGIAIVLCICLCFAQPRLARAFLETGKSVANTVIAVLPDSWLKPATTPPTIKDPDTSEATEETQETEPTEETEPGNIFELDEDFGPNADDPTYTRVAQWTAVEHMINKGELLFGFGYNCFPEGMLRFRFDKWVEGYWVKATTLDVGFVSLLTESGLIGTLASLGLLVYMAIIAWRKRKAEEGFNFFQLMLYILLLYLLVNYLAAFLNDGIIWLLFGLFFARYKLEKLPKAEEGDAL